MASGCVPKKGGDSTEVITYRICYLNGRMYGEAYFQFNTLKNH